MRIVTVGTLPHKQESLGGKDVQARQGAETEQSKQEEEQTKANGNGVDDELAEVADTSITSTDGAGVDIGSARGVAVGVVAVGRLGRGDGLLNLLRRGRGDAGFGEGPYQDIEVAAAGSPRWKIVEIILVACSLPVKAVRAGILSASIRRCRRVNALSAGYHRRHWRWT
ncbi:hypothetical protein HYQ46_008029 [Verticillium longisporum]|nr:hypothetical protein HYQ46_008029 [Verticillium longisporum]